MALLVLGAALFVAGLARPKANATVERDGPQYVMMRPNEVHASMRGEQDVWLAVRQAVAAHVPITYKILHNGFVSMTGGQKIDFVDREDDHPTDVLPGIGQPTWSKDGSRMLVNSAYDLWSLALDGSGGARLTNGAAEKLQHRVVTFGGAASLLGTVASAFSIAQTQSISEFFMTGSMAKVVTLSCIVLMLMIRPQGLFASKVRR